jgi:hypothetical protein
MHAGHYFSFIWAQMWPNIFAPGFWTIFGIGLSHYHLRKHVNNKHAELHERINQLDKGSQ